MSFIKRYCLILLAFAVMFTLLPSVPVLAVSGNEAPAVEHVYITSDSSAVVGAALTVNYTCLNGASESSCTYQWYSCNFDEIRATGSESAVKIDGAESKTYTLTESENNKYIFCVVTPQDGKGEISLSYGKVTAQGEDSPSVDSNSMRIWANDLSIGSTLYAHYTYQNPAGTTETGTQIQWQRADSFQGTYTDIEDATGTTYVIKPEDYGKFITFKVMVSGRTAQMNNRVYCSPENLIAYSHISGNYARNPVINGKVNAASDFIADNAGDMTWSVQNPAYTIDAGRIIEWTELFLLMKQCKGL